MPNRSMINEGDTPTETVAARVGRSWREIVAPYARANALSSFTQLANTGAPFLAITGLMLYALNAGFWIAIVLALPAAALLVRLFAIQHDCGHGSFFKSRWANDLFGRILGIFTMTPYASWGRAHA